MLVCVLIVKLETPANNESCLHSLFGFDEAFLHQGAVELLDVRVHTLPVGLVHSDQVVWVQQCWAACQPPADRVKDRVADKHHKKNTDTEL